MDARRTAEQTARLSYGKLLSFLAAWSRDLIAAEDALAEAFASALETWPVSGVPTHPEAWLTTVARRKLIDRMRRQATERLGKSDLALSMEKLFSRIEDAPGVAFQDERLKLLFVCAHPGIDESIRTPLMLQTVLGIDAARIASAFVISPASMSKRLVRAKTKIKAAGIPFEVPDSTDLAFRLSAVLEAIYGAYGSSWDDGGSEAERLTEEALCLARLTVELLPREAEAKGLLALMLFCESRRKARRDPAGSYVSLDMQAVEAWDAQLIDEAEDLLLAAAELGCLGRFQLEAAIQSAHTLRRRLPINNWADIAHIYEGLVQLYPTIGASVGQAAAVLEASGPEAALRLLKAFAKASVSAYQPYWAVLGEAYARSGRLQEAGEAFQRAAGLAQDEAPRTYLLAKAALCLPRP